MAPELPGVMWLYGMALRVHWSIAWSCWGIWAVPELLRSWPHTPSAALLCPVSGCPDMVMDALQLEFESSSFDAVIDKGTSPCHSQKEDVYALF